MLGRATTVVLAAVLLAACSDDNAEPQPGADTDATADRGAIEEASRCNVENLLVTVTGETVATGHGLSILVLTNVGPSACRVSGTPDVVLLSSDGSRVEGTHADEGGFILAADPAQVVVLEQNDAAYVGIETTHICGNGETPPHAADTVEVTMAQGTSVAVPASIAHCDSALVGPFRRTRSAI